MNCGGIHLVPQCVQNLPKSHSFDYIYGAGADLVSTCLVKSVLRAEVSVTSLIRGIIYNCQ
jgi:hypothetical protein